MTIEAGIAVRSATLKHVSGAANLLAIVPA